MVLVHSYNFNSFTNLNAILYKQRKTGIVQCKINRSASDTSVSSPSLSALRTEGKISLFSMNLSPLKYESYILKTENLSFT